MLLIQKQKIITENVLTKVLMHTYYLINITMKVVYFRLQMTSLMPCWGCILQNKAVEMMRGKSTSPGSILGKNKDERPNSFV